MQHRIDEPGFLPRTANHLEIHNVYGMENSRATYEGLLTLEPNQRPFVLTRASYAGGPAVRGDLDGRQQLDVEPPADDGAAADQPGPERLRDVRGGCRRLRRLAVAGAAHPLD